MTGESEAPAADPEDLHRNLLVARLKPAESCAAKLAEEGTVRMVFPCNIGLALADHSFVKFERGPEDELDRPFVRPVPASLADHPYLKRAGVKRVKREE